MSMAIVSIVEYIKFLLTKLTVESYVTMATLTDIGSNAFSTIGTYSNTNCWKICASYILKNHFSE